MSTPLKVIFAKDLAENLYPANEFYKNSRDDSAFMDGIQVNLPQAGTAPSAVKNPTSFPLTTEKRSDTAETYDLDLFATLPTHLRMDEDLVVNYGKRAAILKDHQMVLQTKIADNFCDKWFPEGASNIVRTTGSAGYSLSTGATGTRKAITYNDFVSVAVMMDKMEIPFDNRFALIPADMYGELQAIDKFLDYQNRGLVDLISKGFIGEILGFKLYKRSRAGVYTNASTPVMKVSGTATAVTDNLAALFWHANSVRRAEGSPEVFINDAQAQYLGSLMNTAVRAGGRISRTDKKGVIALVQTLVT